jgi:hypothetical protein
MGGVRFYMSIKEAIAYFLNEAKASLKEYAAKQEVAPKTRAKKLLILSITGVVLMALGISLAGVCVSISVVMCVQEKER